MAPKKLSELLREPFGPYPDHYILNPDWPRKGNSTRPSLTCVEMHCGGTPIGLDETEFLKEAPSTSRVVQHPVEVYGILEITSLKWLSETGRKWLEEDLRVRDATKSILKKPSNLTLEAVYGDGVNSGSCISVYVNFKKVMNAAYSTLEDDPKSLILYAEDRNRSFQIESLHCSTYILSCNFLERYRLRRTIHELIADDKARTPIEKRDIEWIVTQYQTQIVPRDKHFRIIYNRDNDDDLELNECGDLLLERPRHVRVRHRAAIRELFAAQAEWLLADQIASASTNTKYLNIEKWLDFVKKVKIARRKARSYGLEWWGSPVGYKHRGSDEILDLSYFGGTREEWDRCLRNAIQSQTESFKRKAKEKESERTAVTRKPHPTKQQPDQVPETSTRQPRRSFRMDVSYQYDTEYDGDSTPPATDSESEHELQGDLDMEPRIPWYCRVPPRMRPNEFTWHCPGCHAYEIDLTNPDEDELENIPEYYADVLRERSWTRVVEENVMFAFGYLVNNHYKTHLKALGIRVESQDGKVLVERSSKHGKTRKSLRLRQQSSFSASQGHRR